MPHSTAKIPQNTVWGQGGPGQAVSEWLVSERVQSGEGIPSRGNTKVKDREAGMSLQS